MIKGVLVVGLGLALVLAVLSRPVVSGPGGRGAVMGHRTVQLAR